MAAFGPAILSFFAIFRLKVIPLQANEPLLVIEL